MRLLIFFSMILFFSCAGPQNIASDKMSRTNSTLDYSAVDTDNSNVADLTSEIRKFPAVRVRGIGARASVYFRNRSCRPMFLLNGEIIQNYYTLYNAVEGETIKLVKVVPPRQAAIYGLRSSSGVIQITTEHALSEAD